jgi:hypothetical protein
MLMNNDDVPAIESADEKPMPQWQDLDNEDSSDDDDKKKDKKKGSDKKAKGDGDEPDSDTSSVRGEDANFDNVPRRGDWEEEVDGKVIVHKGQGVKNRKTTLMNVISDPRFAESTDRFQVEYSKIISKLVCAEKPRSSIVG